MCPGQNESAGKRKGSRLRKGAPWLKTMLVQCAWAAKRAKNSYYRAQFFRLQARHGPQKAICAVAASILTAIYHMLKNGTFHQDLGADYFIDSLKPIMWAGFIFADVACSLAALIRKRGLRHACPVDAYTPQG